MIYTLTDKLNFNEPPQIEIKGKKLTVDNGAKTVLEVMDVVQNQGELEGAKAVISLLFSDKDIKAIDGFKLNITDYITLAKTAMTLALGNDPDSEEQSGE